MRVEHKNQGDVALDAVNELVDAINQIETNVAASLAETKARLQAMDDSSPPHSMWIRLTDEPEDGEYEWEQVRRNSSGDDWETMPGGLDHEKTDSLAQAYDEAEGLPTGSETTPVLARSVLEDGNIIRVMFFHTGSKFHAEIIGNDTHASDDADVGGGGTETVVFRWRYGWRPVKLDSSGNWTSDGADRLATGDDYALNMAEAHHTAQYQWGIDIENADYPVGHRPRPVGGGGTDNTHRYGVIVEMEILIDDAGNGRAWFHAMGSHDGSCE